MSGVKLNGPPSSQGGAENAQSGDAMNGGSNKSGVKYRKICETLRGEILDGRHPCSKPFPSVVAIGRRFGVSRLTAVKVIDLLKGEGLLRSQWGRGTFVTGCSRKIGVIVPGMGYSEIFPPIISRISELAQSEGYSIILGDIPTSDPRRRAEMTRRFVETLIGEGVSGVICEPLEFLSDMDDLNRENMAKLDAEGIPVVLMDSDIEPPPRRSSHDVVGINNLDAGIAIAEHLFSRRVKRIGFQLRPNWAPSVRNRLRGVRTACAEHAGARCDVLAAEPDDLTALRRFLRAKGRPDAFVCGCDKAAAKLRQTLKKAGLEVPRDVLLCGFDDVEIAALTSPALTTVRQPCADIGEALFKALLFRMRNPSAPAREILLPAPLVVRESTQRGQ